MSGILLASVAVVINLLNGIFLNLFKKTESELSDIKGEVQLGDLLSLKIRITLEYIHFKENRTYDRTWHRILC